jgi:hypothetical protein
MAQTAEAVKAIERDELKKKIDSRAPYCASRNARPGSFPDRSFARSPQCASGSDQGDCAGADSE